MSTHPAHGSIPERALRATFIWLSHRKALGRLSTRIPITRPMVRRFIAGESLAEVLPALERLRGRRIPHDRRCAGGVGRYGRRLRRRPPAATRRRSTRSRSAAWNGTSA